MKKMPSLQDSSVLKEIRTTLLPFSILPGLLVVPKEPCLLTGTCSPMPKYLLKAGNFNERRYSDSHALPLYHTHGLFVAINVSLLAGSSMLLMKKFDADAICKRMPQASVLMGVPTFYVRLLEHPDLWRMLPKICVCLFPGLLRCCRTLTLSGKNVQDT